MTYPTLSPSSRTYSHGEWPVSNHRFMTGRSQRTLHANAKTQQSLKLTYENQPLEDFDAVLLHYNRQLGTNQAFSIPEAVLFEGWNTASEDKVLFGGTQVWRYSSEPRIRSRRSGLGTLEVNLETAQRPDLTGCGVEIDIPGQAPGPELDINEDGLLTTLPLPPDSPVLLTPSEAAQQWPDAFEALTQGSNTRDIFDIGIPKGDMNACRRYEITSEPYEYTEFIGLRWEWGATTYAVVGPSENCCLTPGVGNGEVTTEVETREVLITCPSVDEFPEDYGCQRALGTHYQVKIEIGLGVNDARCDLYNCNAGADNSDVVFLGNNQFRVDTLRVLYKSSPDSEWVSNGGIFNANMYGDGVGVNYGPRGWLNNFPRMHWAAVNFIRPYELTDNGWKLRNDIKFRVKSCDSDFDYESPNQPGGSENIGGGNNGGGGGGGNNGGGGGENPNPLPPPPEECGGGGGEGGGLTQPQPPVNPPISRPPTTPDIPDDPGNGPGGGDEDSSGGGGGGPGEGTLVCPLGYKDNGFGECVVDLEAEVGGYMRWIEGRGTTVPAYQAKQGCAAAPYGAPLGPAGGYDFRVPYGPYDITETSTIESNLNLINNIGGLRIGPSWKSDDVEDIYNVVIPLDGTVRCVFAASVSTSRWGLLSRSGFGIGAAISSPVSDFYQEQIDQGLFNNCAVIRGCISGFDGTPNKCDYTYKVGFLPIGYLNTVRELYPDWYRLSPSERSTILMDLYCGGAKNQDFIPGLGSASTLSITPVSTLNTTTTQTFPNISPSRRNITYGDWTINRFGSEQEVTLPLPSTAKKSDVIMDLVYANREDSVARSLLQHYDGTSGTFNNFSIADINPDKGTFAGWDGPMSDNVSKGRWVYANAPRVVSTHPGFSTTTVRLINLEPELIDNSNSHAFTDSICPGYGSDTGGADPASYTNTQLLRNLINRNRSLNLDTEGTCRVPLPDGGTDEDCNGPLYEFEISWFQRTTYTETIRCEGPTAGEIISPAGVNDSQRIVYTRTGRDLQLTVRNPVNESFCGSGTNVLGKLEYVIQFTITLPNCSKLSYRGWQVTSSTMYNASQARRRVYSPGDLQIKVNGQALV